MNESAHAVDPVRGYLIWPSYLSTFVPPVVLVVAVVDPCFFFFPPGSEKEGRKRLRASSGETRGGQSQARALYHAVRSHSSVRRYERGWPVLGPGGSQGRLARAVILSASDWLGLLSLSGNRSTGPLCHLGCRGCHFRSLTSYRYVRIYVLRMLSLYVRTEVCTCVLPTRVPTCKVQQHPGLSSKAGSTVLISVRMYIRTYVL